MPPSNATARNPAAERRRTPDIAGFSPGPPEIPKIAANLGSGAAFHGSNGVLTNVRSDSEPFCDSLLQGFRPLRRLSPAVDIKTEPADSGTD